MVPDRTWGRYYCLHKKDVVNYYVETPTKDGRHLKLVARPSLEIEEWLRERSGSHLMETRDVIVALNIRFCDESLEAEFILRFGHRGSV